MGFSMNFTQGQIPHVEDDEAARMSISKLLRVSGYGSLAPPTEPKPLS